MQYVLSPKFSVVDKKNDFRYLISKLEGVFRISKEAAMGKETARWFFFLVLSFLFLSTPFFLQAGGWNNTLLGCRAIGLGGAFAGLANDPSAIFYNPGGLVFQENRMSLAINGFYIWPTFEYTPPSGNTIRSRYESPLPQFFLAYKSSQKLSLGLGFYVPYAGSGVDWKQEDLGFPFRSSLGVYSITPTVAYQVTENLSVGLNLNFYTAKFHLKTEMPSSGTMTTEETGSAQSASLGLFYRYPGRGSLGFTVRGPAKIRLQGVTEMPFGPYELKFDSETVIRLPWDFEAGISFSAGDRLTLTADAQYTLWSVLEKVEKTIKGIPYSGDHHYDEMMNFKNILILRMGAEYSFPQGIFLRGGIGFDRYATPLESLSISNIDVDKLTLLGGFGIRMGRIGIDFASAYGWGKERETTSPLVVSPPIKQRFNLNIFIVGIGVTFYY